MLSCDTIIFVKQNRYTISYYFECISDVFPMYFRCISDVFYIFELYGTFSAPEN